MKKLILITFTTLLLFLTSCIYSAPNYLANADAVKVGTPMAKVVELWGYPDKVNSTSSEYGTSNQWVYNDYTVSAVTYIYFDEDKKVSYIQRY